MFDHLVEANGLEQVMEQHGLELPQDLDFIKEQIAGPLNNGPSQRRKVPVAVQVLSKPQVLSEKQKFKLEERVTSLQFSACFLSSQQFFNQQL